MRQSLLGLTLGAFVAGFLLEAGVLSVLLIGPTLVWALREPWRPFGLSGVVFGVGAAIAGLLLLADARCSADVSCSIPDQTGYLVVAGILITMGAVLFLATARRRAP